MVIVYESKTGFTKKYADMLAAKTGLKVFRVILLSLNRLYFRAYLSNIEYREVSWNAKGFGTRYPGSN